eukprot:6671693-Pyramimonas_sp.AAC.1
MSAGRCASCQLKGASPSQTAVRCCGCSSAFRPFGSQAARTSTCPPRPHPRGPFVGFSPLPDEGCWSACPRFRVQFSPPTFRKHGAHA